MPENHALVHRRRLRGKTVKTTNIDRLIKPLHERRRKPRIRMLSNGECLYSFTTNSWIVFDNIQRAYRYLKNTIEPRDPNAVYNTNW